MTGSHFRGFVLWPQWTKRVQGPLPDRMPMATKGWLLSQIHWKWEWGLVVLQPHFSQRESCYLSTTGMWASMGSEEPQAK